MAKRRTSKRLVVLAVAAAAITVAGVVAQLGLGGSGKVEIGTGSVSALSRAARTTDALPSNVLGYPFAERNFASAKGMGSRLLKTEGSVRLYAVPGKGGMMCLVEVDSVAGTAGGACADRNVLRTGPIYMADRDEDGSTLVVGLVGDGHTYAQAGGKRTVVENNAFVLRDVADSELTVGSPTAAQKVELGD